MKRSHAPFSLMIAAMSALVFLLVSPPLVAATSTPSAPATHSYDDGHTDDRPEGSGPALWILLGAVSGLSLIGATLLWSGRKHARH